MNDTEMEILQGTISAVVFQNYENGYAVLRLAAQDGNTVMFSEYDQKQKYYSHKSEIVHTEIILPPHAPPEYADRNTLWNAAEAIEKQWNSQLARRFVLAIPRELPRSQYADLIRDYCREFFVSKGMIADFAIHDKGDGNPHAHILLTMRAMDETGKWLPKSRKVYDLDENGQRIQLASGRWKSHKEDTVDWNDQKYAEIWRQGWADTANRYLEAIGSPERLDLRSYARQGIDKIPTVHMGPAVSQLEKKGIQTNIGNLNRDIKAANSLMQSIRQMVRSLKGWLSGLKGDKGINPLSGIRTKVKALRAADGFQIAVRRVSPALPPYLGVLLVVPVHGVLLVAFPSAGRKLDTLAVLVKVVNLPALGEPFPGFVHRPHGKKDVGVGISVPLVMDGKIGNHALGNEKLPAVVPDKVGVL